MQRLLLKALLKPFAVMPLGAGSCCICGHRVARFLPYELGWRGAPPLLRALDVIGSDLDNYECPRCGSHDRERHLLLYMKRTGLLSDIAGKAVAHFAPELHLSRRIEAHGPALYVRCDLYPASSDVRREDMLAMSFATASLDIVIANHVLEHVDDDWQALAEIRRVLKPGGLAILQTPFSQVLEGTWEDRGVVAPQARLQAFGQADHVRLYGRDFFDRVASAGFRSRVATHAELLAEVSPKSAGVNATEPFMLFQRLEDGY